MSEKQKAQQKLFHIPLEFPGSDGSTHVREIPARAASRKTAENRALKRNPNAIGVKRA